MLWQIELDGLWFSLWLSSDRAQTDNPRLSQILHTSSQKSFTLHVWHLGTFKAVPAPIIALLAAILFVRWFWKCHSIIKDICLRMLKPFTSSSTEMVMQVYILPAVFPSYNNKQNNYSAIVGIPLTPHVYWFPLHFIFTADMSIQTFRLIISLIRALKSYLRCIFRLVALGQDVPNTPEFHNNTYI